MGGLHVHARSGAIAGHRLALTHVHLALAGQALGGGDGVIIGPHGAVAAGRYVHGATGHSRRLVRTRALHGNVIGT